MIEYDMYISGMSIPDINKETGIPLSTLRFRFKSRGILRSKRDSLLLASKQGKLGSGMMGKTRVFSEEWKSNISKGKKGKGAGLCKKSSGYIEITMGENKGRSQHVVIMEGHIGRKLLPQECVHHKNEIRHDNRLCNLELMTKSEHASHHATERNKTAARNSKGQYQ